MSNEWRRAAACLGMDTERFFPTDGDHAGCTEAKRVCMSCPVRLDCLEEELAIEGGRAKENRYGIRGGMAPRGREGEYKRRLRAGEPVVKPKPNPKPKPKKPGHFGPKLDDAKRAEIRALYADGLTSPTALARRFDVNPATIRRVLGMRAA